MQPNNFSSLEQIIDRQPSIVTPETRLTEVIRRMQEWANSCYLTEGKDASDADSNDRINNSCALIVEDAKLQGIFTERDLVKLIATERDFAEIAVGEVMSRELITLTATGTEDVFTVLSLLRQYSIRHLPIIDEDGSLLGLITEKNLCQNLKPSDIVKWRRVEEVMSDRADVIATLAESEQLFCNMADNAPMMVWVTDKMGNCTYVNQNWCEFTGQTKETVLGFGWLDAVHREDRERTHAIFLRATQCQEAFRLDYRVRRHDGEYCWAIDAAKPWIDNDGQFKGYIGSVIDISEQQAALRERKSREKILKDIASGVTIPTGVNFLPSLVDYLSKTLKVDYAFVAQLIQSETDKIKTLAVYGKGKIIDNFEYHLAGTPCQNVVGQQFCIYPQTVRQLFPDDRLLQDLAAESYAGMPIFNSNGTALGLIAIIDSKPLADISSMEEVLKIFATRATSELERQQAESIFKESEQIMGFAKLLPLKLTDLDEETKGFFQIMETNAQRGSALVQQILTFARGLEGDRGTVQIRHLIAEIKQIIAETFPKSIDLKISVPKNLWTVNGDVNQLHQVLMNLTVNARDAMLDGGTLTIKAENFTVDADYARLHIDASVGFYLLITVTDTGMGIPPEIIERIFEPFFTTKELCKNNLNS